jgi:ankyrin repeat protein
MMLERELTGNHSDLSKIVLPAAARGDLEAVRAYVKSDPGWVTARGPHGRTMLWEAVNKGRAELVEFLIEEGADVHAAGCYFKEHFVDVSPYCLALLKGREEIATALREGGANLDVHNAAYLGRDDLVASFLDGNPRLLNRDFGAAPRAAKTYSSTPLHYAVAGAWETTVELLISRGADVKRPGGMLLRWAVWRDRTDIVEILLDHGADPADSGISEWAADSRLSGLVRQYGYEFDIDAPNWMGYPALVNASRGNHNAADDPSRVVPLLRLGADVNVRDFKGKTPLHRASQAGFTEITEVLLDYGADINAVDGRGESPLFDAVRAGRAKTVELLLGRGAAPELANRSGLTPAQVAQKAKRPEVREVSELLARGKRGIDSI